MDIGKRIKKLRKQQKLSQADLSAISGISQTSISYIEANHNHVMVDTLLTLAKALNVSLYDIIQEEERSPDQRSRS